MLQIATEKSDLERLIRLLTYANSTVIVSNIEAQMCYTVLKYDGEMSSPKITLHFVHLH